MALMQDDADADDEYGDVHPLTVNVPTRTATGGGNVSPGFQTFTHDHSLMVATVFSTMGMPPPMMMPPMMGTRTSESRPRTRTRRPSGEPRRRTSGW